MTRVKCFLGCPRSASLLQVWEERLRSQVEESRGSHTHRGQEEEGVWPPAISREPWVHRQCSRGRSRYRGNKTTAHLY